MNDSVLTTTVIVDFACFAEEIGQYEYNILKNVDLPMVPRDECTDALKTTRLGPKFMLHESFVCAGGEEGKDTCTVSKRLTTTVACG